MVVTAEALGMCVCVCVCVNKLPKVVLRMQHYCGIESETSIDQVRRLYDCTAALIGRNSVA